MLLMFSLYSALDTTQTQVFRNSLKLSFIMRITYAHTKVRNKNRISKYFSKIKSDLYLDS